MSIGSWWRNRRKRKQALRAAFVKFLVKSPVKDVKFSKGCKRVSLAFLGGRVRYAVRVGREAYVAEWSRRRPEIRVDAAMLPRGSGRLREFRALCVHEAVEKHLAERYGLPADREAHDVATAKERQYLQRAGGDWRKHQAAVCRVWKRRGGH